MRIDSLNTQLQSEGKLNLVGRGKLSDFRLTAAVDSWLEVACALEFKIFFQIKSYRAGGCDLRLFFCWHICRQYIVATNKQAFKSFLVLHARNSNRISRSLVMLKPLQAISNKKCCSKAQSARTPRSLSYNWMRRRSFSLANFSCSQNSNKLVRD